MELVEQGQIYKHYKGNEYLILAVAKHSETEESLVVYTDGSGSTWARPYDMFIGNTSDGVKRFELKNEIY